MSEWPLRNDLIGLFNEYLDRLNMIWCSGQNIDKWQARGLTPVQIPGFRTPGVAGSLLHYACRVMHKASAEPLSSHTFFFGEIDKVYTDIGG